MRADSGAKGKTSGREIVGAVLDPLRRLRLEEALFVLLFIPSTAVTVWANLEMQRAGEGSRKIEGGILRLVIVAAVAALLPLLEKARRSPSASRALRESVEFFRVILPFALCSAVYTNLHDTVRFVNPHDIHTTLAMIEERLFGLQPVVWAEQFITPARTEFFSFFYTNFFLVAPSVALLLWFTGRRREARETLLGVIITFYTGYVLYVIFPAAPPRLYFESLGLFSVNLGGGAIADFQNALIAMMPNHASRAAFPSLHTAVSLVSLYYAWRYCRRFFPILLFFVIGLLASTVYLRHHYVVDLIAGAFLVPWTAWVTPRLDRLWQRFRGGRSDRVDSERSLL
ncbi:MAG: inositol phosphorylceramide synthase [Candidatus Eisenbacteria bacterium]|nr:inositol phosphorylceramide synthase [Candidatus Eisenbacteria bacterium]